MGSISPTPVENARNRVQQDFSRIAESIQSNHLAGAQQAYKDLVRLTPAGQSAIQSDLASLGTALQSGSVSGAQTALSKLQTDFSPGTSASATGPTTFGSVIGSLVKNGLKLLG
ncbi:MAG: hypothetical protein ABSB15_23330 [Bryobacteraceae bacterium]